MQESGLCPAMAMPTQSVGSRWNQIAHFTFLIVSRKEMRLVMKTSPFFFVQFIACNVSNVLLLPLVFFFFFLLGQVVVRGCRSLESIISESCDMDLDKFEWVSGRLRSKDPVDQQDAKHFKNDELLFCRSYEWRLNMETGEVKERNLTGTLLSIEFPMINPNFNGVKNKFGYAQTVHGLASATSGQFYIPNSSISAYKI
jgi:hypothetical protein